MTNKTPTQNNKKIQILLEGNNSRLGGACSSLSSRLEHCYPTQKDLEIYPFWLLPKINKKHRKGKRFSFATLQ